MTRILVLLWTMALTALVHNSAHAIQENIRFQRIKLDDGLSQESVTAIFQDRRGFMWFGTQEGLNRFDGYQFKVFLAAPSQRQGFVNDWVHAIEEDTEGTIWLGTDGGGVALLDPALETFASHRHDPADPTSLNHDIVRCLFRDSKGRMWVGTLNGLALYQPAKNSFKRFLAADGQAEPIVVRAITEGPGGHIWIGTEGAGVFRLNPDSGVLHTMAEALSPDAAPDSTKISNLLFDDAHRLWIGSFDMGVFLVDVNTHAKVHYQQVADQPRSLSNNVVYDVYRDRQQRIWIATEKGLNLWHEDTGTFEVFRHEPDNPYSLANDGATALFEDAGGVFWVGSFSGLNKWNTATASFKHLRASGSLGDSLSNGYINAISASDDGQFWVGTYGGGLNRVTPETGDITHYRHDAGDTNSLSDDRVMALLSEGDRVWVGTRLNGLDRLDVETGTFSHFRHDPEHSHSISANGVTSLLKSNAGKIWVGTYGGGLNLFDPETERFTRIAQTTDEVKGLSSDKVLSIFEDSQGLLWIGTWGGGLNLLNPVTGAVTVFTSAPENPETLGSNSIWAVTEDALGNMWIATQGGGLNKLSAQQRESGQFSFERITREQTLPSNTLFSIGQDRDGFLWLSSNRGLTKYNPLNGDVLNYDSSHGLQGNEFNAGAFFQEPDGTFWFGGTNGVSVFNPSQIKPNAHVPPVVLTRFLKLNQATPDSQLIQQTEGIEISYQDYLIAFEFAGLDYASPGSNQYRYRLDGFDEGWIEAGDLRRATYTNLPAGDYTFRVKAANNDGIWNDKGAALALTVLPAPWQSWWAYVFYVLAFVLGVTLLVRGYFNKLQKEAENRIALENEVQRRTAQLQKMNEQLLNASFTDQLTGLHNRRYLTDKVEQECAAVLRDIAALGKNVSEEQGPRLFFLMFDLDGFKPINDTYGHEAGDHVITQVSELLQSVCRKSDTLIRWGGDEFLVMGRINHIDEVTMLAERLREKIANHFFDIKLKQSLHLSCSVGFSFFPFSAHYPQALSWEQVQVVADRAMYYSKDAGRNYWAGIQATGRKPPVSIMNTLTNNLPEALEKGVARLMTPNGDDENTTSGL